MDYKIIKSIQTLIELINNHHLDYYFALLVNSIYARFYKELKIGGEYEKY